MRKMLKTVKKTTPKKTAKATGPRKKLMGAKKTVMAKAKKTTPKTITPKDNVIRRLFEMREARRKKMAEEAHKNGTHATGWGKESWDQGGKHQGFSRFAGPRRRAA